MIQGLGDHLSVSDFNTACPLGPDMTPAVGSLRWMAPEVLKGKAYDQAADVYAFGMVCYEMVSYVVPFATATTNMAALNASQGGRPALPDVCPGWLAEVICACWQADPAQRPTFEAIRETLDARKVLLRARERVARPVTFTKHRSMPSNAEDIETDDPMTVDGEEAHEVAMNLIALQSR